MLDRIVISRVQSGQTAIQLIQLRQREQVHNVETSSGSRPQEHRSESISTGATMASHWPCSTNFGLKGLRKEVIVILWTKGTFK